MEVVARQKGFYGTLREVGDAFRIAGDTHFSTRWMYDAASPEGKALVDKQSASKNVVRSGRPSRDALTGERLEAGGSAEMILELTRQIKVLQGENAMLKERITEARAAGEEPADRSDTADAVKAAGPDTGQSADFKSGSGRKRRRRAHTPE